MGSKETIISEISSVVANLSLKIETLQAKIDELCKKTGGCDRVKAVNKELLLKKDKFKK